VADRLGEWLDGQADEIVRRLERTLQSIEVQVTRIIPRDPSEAARVAAAADAGAQIVRIMAAYDSTVDELLDLYVQAAAKAREAFSLDAELSQGDAALIDAMIRDTADELRAAGLQYAQQISQVVYMGAIAGADYEEIVMQVRQLLVGGTDRRGRPLSSYAGTIAQTRYMQVFATTTQRLAAAAGVERYRYSGTLVRDSREWCRRHLGQVLTMDEIQSWASKDWQGKAPGDPFITRGGWNCRHYWRPIID